MLFWLFILQSVKTYAATLPADYFRSAQSGSWDVPGTWESSANGSTNWTVSTLVPTSEAGTVTIRNGHSIIVSNSASVDQLVVEGGGVLHLATNSSASLTVNDGSGADITILSGGTFRHNTAVLPTFSGSSAMELQSGGILEVANDYGANAHSYANTASDIFSHIAWNDGAVFHWNTASAPADGIIYFSPNPAVPVFRISKAVTMGGGNATVINGLLEANANVSFAGGGAKTFRNGIIGNGKVGATALNGGPFIINGVTAQLGGVGIVELNNNGLSIANGTTLTLASNKTINNYSAGTGTVTNTGTLIGGNYVISGNSKMQIDGTVTTTNVNGLTGKTNTTFSTASGFGVNTLGTFSVIEYNRDGDQTVTTPLTYYNLKISGSGTKTVVAEADLIVLAAVDINAGNTLALNGINHLKLNNGGTLTVNSNAVFDNAGESQVSGGGNPTINIYGTFITRDAQGFTGTNTSIPGATTSPAPTISVNIFPGSTIEYGKMGNQAVNARSDYKNITFSGSGTKTLSSFNPAGNVTIKDNVEVDASNKTFGDANTNLIMTGGRLKIGGTGTKPDIAGSYSLRGGVIEFTNSGSTKQTMRATITYYGVDISGSNVNNSSGNTMVADGGFFTVKAGGNFDNNAFRIDGTTGIQTFTLQPGSTFKTGTKGGFSGDDEAALKGFEIFNVDPKSTIVYSRAADQTISPFPGYPTLLLKGSGNKTVVTGNVVVASAADSIVIDPNVVFKINTGARADFNYRMVFIRSTAAGTGMIGTIADGPSALLNVTNVTVERYVPARRSYRFLSPGVNTAGSIKTNWMEGVNNTDPYGGGNINPAPGYGTHITGTGGSTNGFDQTVTNNPSVFTFNNAAQKWEALQGTNATLAAGTAYRLFIRGSRSTDLTTNTPPATPTTIRSVGYLSTGPVTFDKSANSPVALSSVAGNFSFLGNPYASSVDWEAVVSVDPSTKQVTGTARDITPTYCTWDPNINTRGGYVYYNAITHTNNIGISKVNRQIQPGQAFFVQTAGGNPDPLLQFKEVHKTTVNNNVFRTYSDIPRLSIQLLTNIAAGSENVADGVVAFFHKDFSFDIENEDSRKLRNNDENMSIVSRGASLSIEGRPAIRTNDSLNLNITQLKQDKYFLTIDGSNFPSNISAFLKDAYLSQESPLDLSKVTTHPFSLGSDSLSFAAGRFTVLFRTNNTLPVSSIVVNAYEKGDGIQVEWTAGDQVSVSGYEIEKSKDGIKFEKVWQTDAGSLTVSPNKFFWFDENVNSGYNFYRIKTFKATGIVELSNIVKVNISIEKNFFNIYPNPIKDNIIRIRINNMDKGIYRLDLFNDLLQQVYTTKINYSGGLSTFKVEVNKGISKGIYRLRISNANVKMYRSLIIN